MNVGIEQQAFPRDQSYLRVLSTFVRFIPFHMFLNFDATYVCT